MAKTNDCWLNGKFSLLADTRIPAMDRGFLFGDGVYEVVPVYHRRPFFWRRHLSRLRRSLREARMVFDTATLQKPARELIRAQPFADIALYIHISRGVQAQRRHSFDDDAKPSALMAVWRLPKPSRGDITKGVHCITEEDFRWRRGDIKCTSMLAAVLLSRRAQDAGAAEVVLFRNGILTESAAANVAIVGGGEVRIPKADDNVLRGITAFDALRMAAKNAGLPFRACQITRPEVAAADEVWLCSSTKNILPVVMLDGIAIGNGKPGKTYRRARAAMNQLINAHCRGE
ncbi:MAG: aminotransferase class IV [Gammaproteobacteria bacterium]